MPRRILEYEVEIIRSRTLKFINKETVYPIVIPIVLYTGRERWNASINFPIKNSKLAKYRGLKEVKYNLIDINNYEILDLLNEKNILSKIMIIEKSKSISELKSNIEKIVEKVSNSKEYDDEQKKLFLNIIENTLINIIDENKLKEYKNKLEGEKNMLAVFEMVEEEKMNSYKNGIKDGKIEGKLEGMIEGKKDGIKMIAKKMLKMEIDKKIIMKATGLKEEEIEKLKNK